MEQEKQSSSMEELTNKANQKYKEIIKENKLTDILVAIGKFPDQTITNDILILLQKPDATCVKRMKEWNYYHRSVNKEEKAIKVISHFLEKYDVDYTDKDGIVMTKGIEQLKTNVGYLFDISQTGGQEFPYLNTNKETVAKHFDVIKTALEKTAKNYEVVYADQEEASTIDAENHKIYIKDGQSLSDTVSSLISSVATVIVKNRFCNGLQNFSDFEKNAVIYAVNSKLGLELPEYNFDVSNLSEENQEKLKDNLQKVRSATKQILANVENAVERAVRDLDKKIEAQEKQIAEEQTAVSKPERQKKQSEVQSV